jgi:hypothetical protein
MPPGLVIPSIFTAVDRFSGPMGMMRGALGMFVNRAEVGMARVERGFRRVLSPLTTLQNTLRSLGLYIGLFSVLMLARNAFNVMADFEQAQVNISAVTGKSINQNKTLADQARVLALRYGEAATSVLDLDLALIKAGKQNITAMAPAILTGSVALKAQPDELAKTVNAVLGAYKMPESSAKDVVDMMSKAADLSVMDWADLQTMIPRAVQSAALAGMDFKDLLALFAAARNAQVHVASGSVAIKNMLISGAIHGKTFNEMLDKIIASPNAIKKAYKMFGQRTLVTALPLAEARKMTSIEDFTKTLMATFKNYSDTVAATRLDSVRGRVTLLKRSWEELIMSVEDGTGSVGAAIKKYLDVGSAMLLITANSDAARSRLSQMDVTVLELANKYLGWLKVIGYVTAGLIGLRVALMLWNAVVVVSKLLMFGWSVAMGIASAAGMVNMRVIAGNAIAAGAYRTAILLARGATLLFSGALFATPLGGILVLLSLLIYQLMKTSSAYNEVQKSANAANKAMTPDEKIQQKVQSNLDAANRAKYGADALPFGKFSLPNPAKGMDWEWNRTKKYWEQIPTTSFMDKILNPLKSMTGMESDTTGLKDVFSTKSLSADSLMNQLQMVQSGKVNIDINNKSGFPAKASSDGVANINMKPQSTWMDD